MLIVAHSLSNHPNDQGEIEPTLDAIPSQLGTPIAASLDNGYFSESNIERLEARGIAPYIATGRISHFLNLPEVCANELEPHHVELPCEQLNADSLITTTDTEDKLSNSDSASSHDKPSEEPSSDNEPSAKLKMASKLKTEVGQAIYRLRKCTVEPVIGIIKETIGFRQFSLRGLEAVTGEWNLVCLAFNLKRLHMRTEGKLCSSMITPTGC